MNITIPNIVSHVIIGIRFDPIYKLQDNFGVVLEDILHSKASPFNAKFFPLVNSASSNERLLLNPETQNTLQLTLSDIILTVSEIEVINSIVPEFFDFVLPYYAKKFNPIFQRVGTIYSQLLPFDDFVKANIKKMIFGLVKDINEMNVKISFKELTEKSYLFRTQDDYTNIILMITKDVGSDNFIVSVDNQRYFKPGVETLSEKSIEIYYKEVNRFYEIQIKQLVDNITRK
jgi:hypothetical protein